MASPHDACSVSPARVLLRDMGSCDLRSVEVLRLTNCRVYRGSGSITVEDLWVKGGRVLDPQRRFWNAAARHEFVCDLTVDCGGALLAPGFIDVQFNGAYGIDFSDASLTPARIESVMRRLPETGVTAVCPTIVSSSPATYRAVLAVFQELRALHAAAHAAFAADRASCETQTMARVLGLHLEGPFISSERRGAHAPHNVRPVLLPSATSASTAPSPASGIFRPAGAEAMGAPPTPIAATAAEIGAGAAGVVESPFIRQATGLDEMAGVAAAMSEVYGPVAWDAGDVAIVTCAPEVAGALGLIRSLSSRGVVMSIGHSNATVRDADVALGCGAVMVTHMFNAMSGFSHRDPGIPALLGRRRREEPREAGHGSSPAGTRTESAHATAAAAFASPDPPPPRHVPREPSLLIDGASIPLARDTSGGGYLDESANHHVGLPVPVPVTGALRKAVSATPFSLARVAPVAYAGRSPASTAPAGFDAAESGGRVAHFRETVSADVLTSPAPAPGATASAATVMTITSRLHPQFGVTITAPPPTVLSSIRPFTVKKPSLLRAVSASADVTLAGSASIASPPTAAAAAVSPSSPSSGDTPTTAPVAALPGRASQSAAALTAADGVRREEGAKRRGSDASTHSGSFTIARTPPDRVISPFSRPQRSPDATATVQLPNDKPYFGLIVDGVHNHPYAVNVAVSTHSAGLVLVTDAMCAMGLPLGSHPLGELEVDIFAGLSDGHYDGLHAVLRGTTTLAGAVVPLDMCLRNLRRFTDCTLTLALASVTAHPARVLGLHHAIGTLRAGAWADVVVLDDGCGLDGTLRPGAAHDTFTVLATLIAGQVAYVRA